LILLRRRAKGKQRELRDPRDVDGDRNVLQVLIDVRHAHHERADQDRVRVLQCQLERVVRPPQYAAARVGAEIQLLWSHRVTHRRGPGSCDAFGDRELRAFRDGGAQQGVGRDRRPLTFGELRLRVRPRCFKDD